LIGDRSGFLQRWVIYVSGGETLGFAIPAAAAGAALAAGLPEGFVVAVSICAGAGEGAALGFAQARVLRSVLPGFEERRWVTATAAGAVVAWVLGWTAPAAADLFPALPPGVIAAIGIVAGCLLLLSLGTSQWFVLRDYVPRPGRWIPANAVAWALAVPVVFVAMALVPNHAPAIAFIVVGIASGLAMAVLAAAGTGYAMTRVLGIAAQADAARPSDLAGRPAA
jgi:hypothetical protein